MQSEAMRVALFRRNYGDLFSDSLLGFILSLMLFSAERSDASGVISEKLRRLI